MNVIQFYFGSHFFLINKISPSFFLVAYNLKFKMMNAENESNSVQLVRQIFQSKEAADFWISHFQYTPYVAFHVFIKEFKDYVLESRKITIDQKEEFWIAKQIFPVKEADQGIKEKSPYLTLNCEDFNRFYEGVWVKRLAGGDFWDKKVYAINNQPTFGIRNPLDFGCCIF